jgi:NADH-quinone oxidoreductase subunit H
MKAFFLYWVIMWIKYSLPRIRIDQMLNFNWKFLTPLSIAALIVTAVLDKVLPRTNLWVYSTGMLVANLLIIWITLTILRSRARIERKRVAEFSPIATPEKAASMSKQSMPTSTTT